MTSFTQQRIIDRIEVLTDGTVQIRYATFFVDDGGNESGGRTYDRGNGAIAPGSSLDGLDPQVVAIANAAWTPEVIASYEEKIAANG